MKNRDGVNVQTGHKYSCVCNRCEDSDWDYVPKEEYLKIKKIEMEDNMRNLLRQYEDINRELRRITEQKKGC